jgi:hypothetical protein
MMMPDTTIGITNVERNAFLNRIREVRPSARKNATTLTRMTVTTENPIVKPYELRIAGSENSTT